MGGEEELQKFQEDNRFPEMAVESPMPRFICEQTTQPGFESYLFRFLAV